MVFSIFGNRWLLNIVFCSEMGGRFIFAMKIKYCVWTFNFGAVMIGAKGKIQTLKELKIVVLSQRPFILQ